MSDFSFTVPESSNKEELVAIIEKQQSLVDSLDIKVSMLQGQIESKDSAIDAFSQYLDTLGVVLADEELPLDTRVATALRLVRLTNPEDLNE